MWQKMTTKRQSIIENSKKMTTKRWNMTKNGQKWQKEIKYDQKYTWIVPYQAQCSSVWDVTDNILS